MKTFQIMIEMTNHAVIFDTAETTFKVDEIVDNFEADDTAKSIKVFRFNEECGNYGLVHQQVKEAPARRMVGFGRW